MPVNFNKSQFRRLNELTELIKANKQAVNCRSFAEKWGVATKTVQRDIDFLRDQMNAPLKYDSNRKSYVFTQPTWSMPSMLVTEGEILSVLLASKVLEQYHGTPAAENLRHIFGKLAQMLPDKVKIDPATLFTRFSFRSPPARTITTAIWSTVIQGLRDQKTLKIRYRKVAPDAAETARDVLVNPYHIANLQGEWYLFGAYADITDKSEKSQRRQFSISRIEKAIVTNASFTVPADFSPAKLLEDTFGRFTGTGTETYHVRLLFTKKVAGLVAEREWQAKQTTQRRRSGDLELTFPCRGLYEVRNWVLAWGHEVKVLEPTELREMVRDEIRLMASNVECE
jgi:proteasome accessory factor B